jgi:uncharacterized iron-regulated membrane protein
VKRLRKLIFWLHLIAGTLGGTVIVIMSATGLLLVYERQITAWLDRSQYFVSPAPGATRLPIGTLLAKVREERMALPSAITVRSDPSEPAAFNFGRDRVLFVNPYTGDVLGEGSQKIRVFFHTVTDWHRWPDAQSASRDSGRAITGACNLIFLFLVISGPVSLPIRHSAESSRYGVEIFPKRDGITCGTKTSQLLTKAHPFNYFAIFAF